MANCSDIEPLVTAYLDSEASPSECEAVDRHLKDCPPCRRRAEVERGARDVLRARAAALASCRAPDGLHARCTARGVGWRGPLAVARIVPLTAAAALVLAVGGILLYGLSNRSAAALAAQLTVDHVKCFAVSPGTDLNEASAVRATFKRRYGWDFAVPAGLATERLELVGARRCLYADGQIAHVLYRHGATPVSLYMLPAASRAPAAVEVMGHHAIMWSSDGNTYVLLGREPDAQLRRVASYCRRSLDGGP